MAEHYWVVGADGKEYGPVSLDGVARWIAEGRVVPATLVRAGDAPPAAARDIPEVAALFPAADLAPPPPPPPPFPGAVRLPAEFRAWAFVEGAWAIVKEDWLPFAAMVFIMTAIEAVPYAGPIVGFIIYGPLMVGIFRAILGRIDGRRPTVGMMFDGFDRFGDAFLATLLMTVLCTIGYIFLIVPGIILTVVWIFTYPTLAETRAGFWQSMEASVALTKGYRMEIFLLGLGSVLIILLGFLACCVGVFVAWPVVLAAFALAYRWLKERREAERGMGAAPPEAIR